MSCEEEQAAYEAARDIVIEIRRELKAYTGVDNPEEVTSEGDDELADILIRLQNAVDSLESARLALHRCLNNNPKA